MIANKRKALTLLEVLISIFIMGIGMLSVLALFPAAADMMGRAIKNYQTAEALINAAAINDGVDFYSSYRHLMQGVPNINNPIPDPPPPLDPAWSGPLKQAIAEPEITGGTITKINVIDPGLGYSLTPPIVSIIGGDGSGAAATATVTNGRVTAVTVTNPGSGYSPAPDGPKILFSITQDFPRYLFLDQVLGYSGLNFVGTFGNVPTSRIIDSNYPNLEEKFFTLNSDLPIDGFGRAEQPAQSLGKFTIAFMLEKPKPYFTPLFVRRYAVVFKERFPNLTRVSPPPDHRNKYDVVGSDYVNYPSSVTVNAVMPQVATRQWLMLTDEDLTKTISPVHVRFVEIRSINEVGGQTYLEISPPLIQNIKYAYHLLDVLWVAYLGV